jgi:glutamine synthetase adenylyltransferase
MSFHPAAVATKQGLSQKDLDELQMIRSKLFVSTREGELDLKLSDGGLADVEFTAQIALLARREFSIDPSTSGMIQYLESIENSWKNVGAEIRERYESLRRVEQLYQLTTSQSGSRLKVRSDEFKRLASVLKLTSEELEAQIKSNLSALTLCLDQVRSFARR